MLTSLIAGLASGETLFALRRARRAAIVYILAGAAFMCGAGFFVGAFYIWLSTRYGKLEAALGMGAGFVTVAIVILLIDRMTARSRAVKAAERRKSDLTAFGVATAVAVLPGLLRSRAGLAAALGPALALAAYAIYRENRKPRPGNDHFHD